jgi:ferric-dicitrate binding protein FerR (iron transport regulator)
MNDELLVSYLLDEASPAGCKQVEDWLAADAENVRHFNQLKLIWEESRKLAQGSNSDENAAWGKWKSGLHREPVMQRVPIRRRFIFSIAAIFIFATIGIALAWLIWNNNRPVQTILVTSHQAVRTDTLPDGSVITLNKNASISYPKKFKGNTRVVELNGEAFFKVKPDSRKPFIVQVKDITVQVLGTSFNIRDQAGATEVIVETGRVQVTRQGKQVLLVAGEKIKTGDAGKFLDKEIEPDQLYNYYRTRQFVCDNTPLWKLVEVLNAAYDTTIVIEKPALRSLLLTTTFNNESLDQVLEVISVTFNVNIVHAPDKILIR